VTTPSPNVLYSKTEPRTRKSKLGFSRIAGDAAFMVCNKRSPEYCHQFEQPLAHAAPAYDSLASELCSDTK
jgi:hypothetical protein